MSDMKETDKIEKNFAETFFNMKCGTLHLSWAVDNYWAKVAKQVMMPNLLAIYDALVKKNIVEKNMMYCGDSGLYYIPNKNRKIIVFTTQSQNFLFVLAPHKTRDYFPEAEKLEDKFGEEYDTHSLHIRQFWTPYDKKAKEYLYPNEKKMLKSIKTVINNVGTLEDFADDSAEYPQRPSLALYRKIDFDLDHYQNKPRFYGDCRDPGYIISLAASNLDGHDIRSVHTFNMLEIITNCYLGCMTRGLEIEKITLKGYS